MSQVEEIIDTLSAKGYTHLELAVGNDALRFLLDDMSVTANGTTYSHAAVADAIHAGNISYYNAGSQNEWSEREMEAIIAYAAEKHIGVIPLINTPGHMDAILDAMSAVGISGAYNGSARTVNVTNAAAVAFTQALVEKYVAYFAEQGCEYFHMGADEYANDRYTSGSMGFGHLISSGKYGSFVSYVNQVAAIIKSYGMKPLAFNDGIYFNQTTSGGTFDPDIIITYWSSGWTNYNVASAAYLANKGHAILNTNDGWYYVLGRNSGNTYSLTTANTNTKNTPVTDIPGSADPVPMGAMICLWCDTPSASYSSNKSSVLKLIEQLADANPDYFVVYTGPEHEFETVTVAATCTADGSVTSSCTICGETSVEVLPALGHDYDAVTTEPTCTADGSILRTCSRCGDAVAEVLPATGHDYGTVTTPPTCTADGSVTTGCTRCGDAVVEILPATGHAYSTVTAEATCTADGYTAEVCANCGDRQVIEQIRATDHAYSAVTTAPTCTEGGSTVHTCLNCGDSYVSDQLPAAGHSYTSVEEGDRLIHTCSRCGDSYAEDLVSYTQVSSIANGNSYVVTVYSGGRYYALSHTGNALSTVTVTVANGKITSAVTEDLLWELSGGKLRYTSGGTTRYLYAGSSGWWGGWWGSSATLSLSTSNSSSVSLSGTGLKIGSYYLRCSGGSITVNRSAGTAYLFIEN